MSVTPDDVQHIASLARLRFTADEEATLADEMTRILGYVDQLGALDTSDVPPMAYVFGASNVFREDRVDQRVTREDALRNAPATDGVYFRVPKVIESEP